MKDQVIPLDFGDTLVRLADGFEVRFFEEGLSDEEYIKRTKEIRRIETEVSNDQR